MPPLAAPLSDDALARIAPLPLSVRCFAGENLRSYSGRLLRANGVQMATLLSWLKAVHRIEPRMGSGDWAAIVRRLGDLAPESLNAPVYTTSGEWITDRRLCIQCCDGEVCSGRAPTIGKICLKHRRWLDTGTLVMRESQLRAEQQFRRALTPLSVTHDGLVMAKAMSCALLAGTPAASVHAESDSLEHAHYVAQVRLATWLMSVILEGGDISRESVESQVGTALLPICDALEPFRVVVLVRQTLVDAVGSGGELHGAGHLFPRTHREPFR